MLIVMAELSIPVALLISFLALSIASLRESFSVFSSARPGITVLGTDGDEGWNFFHSSCSGVTPIRKKLPVRSGKQPDSADHRLAFSMLLACEFLRIHQRL